LTSSEHAGFIKNFQEVQIMSKKKFVVSLSDEDRQALHTYVNTGIHSARSIKRARILLLADNGDSDPAIATQIGVCRATVFNIRRRYWTEGLQAALEEKPRSGAPRTFSGRDEANLSVLACSSPPEGYQRWTVRLLADRLVRLEALESISHMTVHRLLKKTS
jgi:transposase